MSYLWFPTYAVSLTSELLHMLSPLPGTPFLAAPSHHLANSYHSSGLGFPSVLLNAGVLPCPMAPLTVFPPAFDKFGIKAFACAH